VLLTVAWTFGFADGGGAARSRAAVVVAKPRHGYSDLMLGTEEMF